MRARRPTLLELLEMTGLLFIVLVLLMTLLNGPNKRDLERQTLCLSNLQALSRAAILYAQDYRMSFPRAWFDADGNGRYDPHEGTESDGQTDYARAAALASYTASHQPFNCPTYPIKQRWDGRIAPVADRHGVSYGYNGRLAEVSSRLSRLMFPGQTILLFDLAPEAREPWAALPDNGNDPRAGSPGNVEERVRANHHGELVAWHGPGDLDTGFAAIGYADGHAKPVKLEFLLQTGAGVFGNQWDPGRWHSD